MMIFMVVTSHNPALGWHGCQFF